MCLFIDPQQAEILSAISKLQYQFSTLKCANMLQKWRFCPATCSHHSKLTSSFTCLSHRSTSCVQLKSARRVMDLVLKDVLVIDGELFLQIIHNSYLNSGQRHKNSLMSLITALLKTAWLLPQFHVTAWRCLNNEKAELFIKKDPFPISVAKWRMHEVGQDDDPVRQQIWTVIERCLASD